MKKSILFFTLIFLCVMGVFHSIDHAWAQVSITFTRAESFTENKCPVPNETFDFDVSISFDTPPTTYVNILVDLATSNFKGTAANGGSSLENDLYFLAADNGGWDEVQQSGTRLIFHYTSINTTLPTSLKVRCRDYGAYGQIYASIEGEQSSKATGYIPWDVNKNKIADGWEKDKGIYVADKAEAIKKAAADDERGPSFTGKDAEGNPAKLTCGNDGDGWSVYDEYRGVFTTMDENDNPAGHTRLDPKTKNVMYTSHTNVAKYGTGALPGIMIHSFTHIVHRLYQQEMKDGKNILNPFTDIYVYNNAKGEVGHTTTVDSRLGRVNYNSNPVGGGPSVPGANSVWSIRIKDNGSDNYRIQKDGFDYVKRLGHATPGSPSQYSLAVILTTNIDVDLENTWRDDVLSAENVTEELKNAKAKHITAAKETLISIVIGHEVGHCLNIQTNCNHLNCIMNYDLSLVFFSDGSFLLIEKEKNPEFEKLKTLPNFNVHHPKFKTTPEFRYKKDTNGHLITSTVPKLSNAHLLNLAVTGQPGSHNNVDDSYFEIGFVNTANQSSSSDTSSDTSPALSNSLVSSDGIYTATSGAAARLI